MRWFLYAPLQLICMMICYITNPIVVLFANENGELHGFLRKCGRRSMILVIVKIA